MVLWTTFNFGEPDLMIKSDFSICQYDFEKNRKKCENYNEKC